MPRDIYHGLTTIRENPKPTKARARHELMLFQQFADFMREKILEARHPDAKRRLAGEIKWAEGEIGEYEKFIKEMEQPRENNPPKKDENT